MAVVSIQGVGAADAGSSQRKGNTLPPTATCAIPDLPEHDLGNNRAICMAAAVLLFLHESHQYTHFCCVALHVEAKVLQRIGPPATLSSHKHAKIEEYVIQINLHI